MNLLLDTHVFIWWTTNNPKLNAAAVAAITDPANKVYVSAVSVWEIAVKRRIGKMVFNASPAAAIGTVGFLELPVIPVDGERAGDFAWPHKDPFDRLLVAQAMRLGAALVTADTVIRAFPPAVTLWAG